MKKFLALFFSLLFCVAFLGQTSSWAEEVVEVPIIMYHSVLKSKKGMYSVHPSLLREDIRYLKNHGYQPIFVKDIIAFCEGKGDLPQKPVVLSFDDGHYNNYYYAYPILKEENFKANLNVVGCYCNYSTTSGDYDNPNYSYLTWREIKELHDSNIFEIGNHTYKMHAFSPRYGIKQKLYESDDEYANYAVPAYNYLAGRAMFIVAGAPACMDDLKAAGIENFIHVRCNVLETLKEYNTKLGIK